MNVRMCFAALILVFACPPAGDAQEYGKIRALQQRAASVVRLKNDFVARVLASYTIPHERNAQGVVVRINMEGRWLEITAIDIVPILRETADKNPQVVAHELLFATAEGTLALGSELTAR